MHLHDLTDADVSLTPEEIESLYDMANVTELGVPYLIKEGPEGHQFFLVALPGITQAQLEVSRDALRAEWDPDGPIRVIRSFRRGMVDLVNLWAQLWNLNWNQEGCLAEPFLHFREGTPRADIVAWFDDQHPDFDVTEMERGAYAVTTRSGAGGISVDLTVAVDSACNLKHLFGKPVPTTLRQAREVLDKPDDPVQLALCRSLDHAIDSIRVRQLLRNRLGDVFPMGPAPDTASPSISLDW